MWRVTVGDSCVGSGMCIGVAPHRFELDADDRSHPVTVEMEPDDSVLDAAASCPMEAIRITHSASGEEIVDLWTMSSASPRTQGDPT
jgi:ferredoxin